LGSSCFACGRSGARPGSVRPHHVPPGTGGARKRTPALTELPPGRHPGCSPPIAAKHAADAIARILSTHPLSQGAWVQCSDDRRRAAIELWWYREPSDQERTESARAAVTTWLEAIGSTCEAWESIRALRGGAHPAHTTGRKATLPRLIP